MPTRPARVVLAIWTMTVLLIPTVSSPADAQQRKSLRWATSSVDSYGYKIAASMTKLVEEALGGEYIVTVQPYPQTTSATKAAMEGNAEIGYTADIAMSQLYAGEGSFKNYEPPKGKLLHTWYAYPMESFMAAPTKDAASYRCLSDFSGKPVFYTTAGFMNWLNFQRIYRVLGYEFKHVQIDTKTNSDAMQGGTIVGSVAYTVAGKSQAPYWKETEVRMDVSVINPCPDEITKLKAAGLTITSLDPKAAFSKDVGVKQILGVPILFAYNVGADVHEDVVYRMLSTFHKNRDKLASVDPGFLALAQDFVGMQVNGVNSNPHVPVHPGLARFLKEHGAWNPEWTIGGSLR
jgi:TRAP transporter TAXI family solute receptor